MGERQEELRERLAGLGFDEVRFATLSGAADPARLNAWIEKGYHADMDWMKRTVEKRLDPGLVLEGARSAVLLGVNYLQGPRQEKGGGTRPAWARYSLYRDYHDSLKPALIQAGKAIEDIYGAAPRDYRYYVDTGPVLERSWAARAGVGFLGKNSMLISRAHGNWLFLASIITKLDLESDPPIKLRGDHDSVGLLCGKCTRCMDACPTQAFPSPGVVDARRCISYQTIENRGVVPRELRAAIGDRIYGCDDCLEVCPWNRFASAGRSAILESRGDIAELPLGEILRLTPARFAEVFKGTAIKRIKLAGILRNACIVAGNSGDPGILGALVDLASHELPMVRVHAVWAIARLGGLGLLASQRAAERDTRVLEEYEAAEDPGGGVGTRG